MRKKRAKPMKKAYVVKRGGSKTLGESLTDKPLKVEPAKVDALKGKTKKPSTTKTPAPRRAVHNQPQAKNEPEVSKHAS